MPLPRQRGHGCESANSPWLSDVDAAAVALRADDRRADLLLADEPGGELDTQSATTVYQLIGELAREHGSAVVMVTHDPAATAIADRTVQIRDGRLSDETQNGQAAIVVGRGGWLRVPEHLLAEAGIGGRAQASLHEGDVVLRRFGDVTPIAAPVEAARAAPAAPGAGPAAELKGIEKSYGTGRLRRQVLAGLDHGFPSGRLSAVVGRSGVWQDDRPAAAGRSRAAGRRRRAGAGRGAGRT